MMKAQASGDDDVEMAAPLVGTPPATVSDDSPPAGVRVWILLGLFAWAFCYMIRYTFRMLMVVYYPMGIICLLIAQQKMDDSFSHRRLFSTLLILDKDRVSMSWLAFLYVAVFFDDIHNKIINGFLYHYPVLGALYVVFVVVLYILGGLSVVWIPSRRLFLTYNQWRVRQPGPERDSLLLRGCLVVGLSVGLWYLSWSFWKGAGPLSMFVTGTVEFCMMGASAAGIVWMLRWAQVQYWGELQNFLDRLLETNTSRSNTE